MKPLPGAPAKSSISDRIKSVDKKTGALIAGALVLGLSFLIFIAWPAWIVRPGLKTKIRVLKGKMSTGETLLKKKPELQRRREEYLQFIEQIKKRVYGPGESSLLLGPISKLAEESLVTIAASQPKTADGKFPAPFDTRYEGTLYEFNVEGGYHELGRFVSLIESNTKLLRVQSFQVKPREEDPKRHGAALTLSAVSQKQA